MDSSPPRACIAVLALMLLPVSAATHGQAPATDQVDPFATARQSIGMLTCRQGARIVATTAAIVANRKTLLTVSHFNRLANGTEISPDKCRFTVSDGRSNRKTASLKISVRQVGGDPFHNQLSRATDWAILELRDDLPQTHEPLLIAEDSNESRQNVRMAGFAATHGRERIWSIDRDCSLRSAKPDSAIFSHDCTSSPGTSGSPLFSRRGTRLEIIGMHVGKTQAGGLAVRISKIAPIVDAAGRT